MSNLNKEHVDYESEDGDDDKMIPVSAAELSALRMKAKRYDNARDITQSADPRTKKYIREHPSIQVIIDSILEFKREGFEYEGLSTEGEGNDEEHKWGSKKTKKKIFTTKKNQMILDGKTLAKAGEHRKPVLMAKTFGRLALFLWENPETYNEREGYFSISKTDYLLASGYTREEIKKDPSLFQKATDEIVSGSSSFPVRTKMNGRMGTFYTPAYKVFVDDDKTVPLKIYPEFPFATERDERHFVLLKEAIRDRGSSGRQEWKYIAHQKIYARSGKIKEGSNYRHLPRKLTTHLREWTVGEDRIRKPKECFKALMEIIEREKNNLVYVEFSNGQKRKKIRRKPHELLPPNEDRFKAEILSELDLEDIRRVKVKFKATLTDGERAKSPKMGKNKPNKTTSTVSWADELLD
jgi:hypothetical protein